MLAACASAASERQPGLSQNIRAELSILRSQDKFRPHLLSGYVGADSQEDVAPLNAAVNDLIDAVLTRPDGPVIEAEIRGLVAKAVDAVDLFATEDRERAYAKIQRVWALLGLAGDPITGDPYDLN